MKERMEAKVSKNLAGYRCGNNLFFIFRLLK